MELLSRERALAVNSALDEAVPLREPLIIYEAIRYSLFPPRTSSLSPPRSKSFLCICVSELFHGSQAAAMPTACAIEMLHAASLIHNDLPCMDDDDLRGSRPTNHKVFGQDMAILAGDALYALAVEHVAARSQGVCGARVLQVIAEMSRAVGSQGMAAGQFLDLTCARTLGLEMDPVQACDATLRSSMEAVRSDCGMEASDANLESVTLSRIESGMNNGVQVNPQGQCTYLKAFPAHLNMSSTPVHSQAQYTDVDASPPHPIEASTPPYSQGQYTDVGVSPPYPNELSAPVHSQSQYTGVEVSPAHDKMSITSVKGLQSMHLFKATSLAECAAVCGAILGEADDSDIERMRQFGHTLGLLSYLVDDFFKVRTPHPGRVSYFKLLGLKKAKD